MTRNDNILYSGSSSASFGTTQQQKVEASRNEQRDQKIEARAKLKPAGEIVMAEIQKEIAELSDIKFAHVKELVASGIPNALEIDMLSNEKTIERLKDIQNRLSNILREPKEASDE